jgi:hypothetical protein
MVSAEGFSAMKWRKEAVVFLTAGHVTDQLNI